MDLGLINVDDLQPGMTLEADLHTPDGRFLLPEGMALEAGHIKTCKAWGVNHVNVVGHDQDKLNADKMAAIDPKLLKESKRFIKPFVEKCNYRHPAMAEIIRISVKQTAKKMENGTFQPPVSVDTEDFACLDFPHQKPGAEDNMSALMIVRQQSELISLPDIFYKILEVMESPFSSAKHIADVISKDSSLSAKLLRLVNSAFYGFPSKIDSISRAVAILGTKELTSLAMGVLVIKVFDGIPRQILDMERFWRHSIGCGVFSSLISTRKLGFSKERFFVAGLLHDIGRLILIKTMPEKCMQAYYLSQKEKIPLYLAEQEIFGFDHARVGGLLCREWKMPVILEKMVNFHHSPSKATNFPDVLNIYLANIMTMALNPGEAGEGVFPVLNENAWDELGLDCSDLPSIVHQAEKNISEIVHIFLDRSEA